MIKKILIVWALSQELNIIKEEIKKLNLIDVKTSFLTTWIGNYNMILNLTRFLEKTSFDIVINIGVCWYKEDYLDFIQVWRIKNLANDKELIIPKILDFWVLKSIASSEKVIFNENEIWDEKYVDMESYWFETVCDSFKLPRIILKIPVDKIWIETKNFDFKKAKNNLKNNINYQELFLKIDSYLETHFNIWKWKYKIYQDIFDNYNRIYNFTFSENEIFKRLYYRYHSLVNKDFNSYFEKNRCENKKDFLINLEKYLEQFLIK